MVDTYDRVNWKDRQETPVSARNLNTMDEGIKKNNDAIKDLQNKVDNINLDEVVLANRGGSSDVIRFGKTADGKMGYYEAGADTVTPFKNPQGTKTISSNGMHDVELYKTANVSVHTGYGSLAANWARYNESLYGDASYLSGDNPLFLENSPFGQKTKYSWTAQSSFSGKLRYCMKSSGGNPSRFNLYIEKNGTKLVDYVGTDLTAGVSGEVIISLSQGDTISLGNTSPSNSMMARIHCVFDLV